MGPCCDISNLLCDCILDHNQTLEVEEVDLLLAQLLNDLGRPGFVSLS